MRTLTVNEVQGVSGGGGPLVAGVGAGISATEYISAHGGSSSWNWGSFAVQVDSFSASPHCVSCGVSTAP